MDNEQKRIDIGDKVILNSGGTEMVVTQTSDTVRFVTCQWTAGDGSPQMTVLPDVCVKKAIH